MADDWRRDDRDRRYRGEGYGGTGDTGRGRGSDYQGDGTIARRGFGNERSGYGEGGRHLSDRERGSFGGADRSYGAPHPSARHPEDRSDRPYWGDDRTSRRDQGFAGERRRYEDYEEPGYGNWGTPSRRVEDDHPAYSSGRSSRNDRGTDYRSAERGDRDHHLEAARRELNDRGDGYVGRTRGHGFAGGEGHGFWREAVDEVRSWFSDDDHRGQTHRGRGPKGHVRSDERIREDVSDRLTDDPHIDASDIEVQVSNREVTLTGMVSSRFEKRHAEDIAESVSGVTHVQNNLRVRHQYGATGTAGSADVGALAGPMGAAGMAMGATEAGTTRGRGARAGTGASSGGTSGMTGTSGGVAGSGGSGRGASAKGTGGSGRSGSGTRRSGAALGGGDTMTGGNDSLTGVTTGTGSGPQGTGLGGGEVGPQGGGVGLRKGRSV